MFSIIIPSWNNLALLKLCVRSIRENSAFPHQIIVHVNEGTDGSYDWVREQKLDHTFSKKNIGICYAMNEAAQFATQSYIVFLNDDMYCCPGWDTKLQQWAKKLEGKLFMLSGTAIEPPGESFNRCIVNRDFGRSVEEFRERDLLEAVANKEIGRPDFQAGGCAPSLVSREWWFKVGGYSVEFSPGMNSDYDFSMKMWRIGCRTFVGVGDSLVYHFRKQTTGRRKMNTGGRRFLDKWGISSRVFGRYFLRQGQPLETIELKEPARNFPLYWQIFRGKIKRRFTAAALLRSFIESVHSSKPLKILPRLSLVVITKNEEQSIGRCLRSVDFANEIVVVDNGSKDKTLDIARSLKAKVIETPDFPGFGPQKNRALNAATGDWILSLDADEWIEPQLAAEIRNVLASEKSADGYFIPRRSRFCGNIVNHSGWNPDYVLRLFRRSCGQFTDDIVHERVVVKGKVKKLYNPIEHESITDLADAEDKIVRYAEAAAAALIARGRTSSPLKANLRGAGAFLRTYVLRLGFLDGKTGWQVANYDRRYTYEKWRQVIR